MKMAEVQAGLGIGVKKFRVVWVFESKQALDAVRRLGLGIRGARLLKAYSPGVVAAPPQVSSS